jgi:hypothetical protein
MTELEKKSWEVVRTRGRDRFLLQHIAKALWILPCAAVFEVCWWLFTGKLLEPLWKMIPGWVFVAFGSGAWVGLLEWNTNERAYQDSKTDEPTH